MDLAKITIFLLLFHITTYTTFVALDINPGTTDTVKENWGSIIDFDEEALHNDELGVVRGANATDLVYSPTEGEGIISGTLIFIDSSFRAASGFISFLSGFATMPMDLLIMIGLPGLIVWILAPIYYLLMLFGLAKFVRGGF